MIRQRGGKKDNSPIRLLVVPHALKARVMKACHDDAIGGHFGATRTVRRVQERFWWENMSNEIKDWVASCHNCQSRKAATTKPPGLLHPIEVTASGQLWSVDLYGPLPLSKRDNKFVIAFTDHFTRWVEAWPMQKIDSQSVAHCLLRVVRRHGAMERLLSDRGEQFLSAAMQEVYSILKVKKVSTTAWHPQTNGMVERFNRTMGDGLSILTDPAGPYADYADEWDDGLKWFVCAYNSSQHSVTGFSPYYLHHGHEMRMPIDIAAGTVTEESTSPEQWVREIQARLTRATEVARIANKQSKAKSKERYDAGHRDIRFAVGTWVWLYLPQQLRGDNKWTHKWDGPFQVKEASENGLTYRLATEGGELLSSRVPVQRLRKWFSPDQRPPADPWLDPEDNFDAARERLLERYAGPSMSNVPVDTDYMPEDTETDEEAAQGPRDGSPIAPSPVIAPRDGSSIAPSPVITRGIGLSANQRSHLDMMQTFHNTVASSSTIDLGALKKSLRETILAPLTRKELVKRLKEVASKDDLLVLLDDLIANVTTYYR